MERGELRVINKKEEGKKDLTAEFDGFWGFRAVGQGSAGWQRGRKGLLEGIVPREKGLKSAVFDRLKANFVVFPLAGRGLQSDRNARFIALSAGAIEWTCFRGYAFVRVKIKEKRDSARPRAPLKFANCLLTFKKINPIIDSSKRFDYPLR